MDDRLARIYPYYNGTCVYVVLSLDLWEKMKDLYPRVFAFGALDDPDQTPDTIEALADMLDEVETHYRETSYRALLSGDHILNTTHL